MSFLNPAGLWALFGLLAVIIIYIIKNRFKEVTISSTYIWRLSEQFAKKKNPFSLMEGLLSLILQLLIVAVLSFTLSNPEFQVPNSAKNYLFVIDTSASMQFEVDGVTRFDKAKGEIVDIVENSTNGSVYSIIVAGEKVDLAILRTTDKNELFEVLDEIQVTSYVSDVENAYGLVQSMFIGEPSLNVYIATDIVYGEVVNLDVLQGYREEKNVSLINAQSKIIDDNLVFNVSVYGYEQGDATIYLKVDDGTEITQTVTLQKDKEVTLSFFTEIPSFSKATFGVKGEDNLKQDSEIVLYSQAEKNKVNALLVSNQPFYLSSALRTIEDVSLTVVSSEALIEESGYDLYIFDGVVPKTMPTDGAVWFFGQNENIPDSGFIIQREESLEQGGYLEYSKKNSTAYKEITQSLKGNSIALSQYYGYSFVRDFETILSYDSDPVLSVGTTPYSYKEVIFHFDLHKSNLPLLYDYVVLLNNLVSFSSPNVLSDNIYSCGDTISFNLPHGTLGAKLITPSGEDVFIDLNGKAIGVRLSEVGSYSLVLQNETEENVYNFYSLFPMDEANPLKEERTVYLEGEKRESELNAIYNDLTWFIVALLLIIIIDWMVYVYEQRKFY